MKFLAYILITVLASFSLNSNVVSAHVLKVDGNIGIVLHVDPSDEPKSGEQSNFYFDIKDKENRFSIQECICSAHVKKGNAEIIKINMSSAAVPHVFAERGVYSVGISGEPKTPGKFQPFQLSWDVRVEPGSAASTDQQSPPQDSKGVFQRIDIILGAVVVAAIVFAIIRRRSKPKHERGPPAK